MLISTLKRLTSVIFFLFVTYTFIYSINAGAKMDFGILNYEWHSEDCNEIGFINKDKVFNIVYKIDDDCQIPTGDIETFKELINESAGSWCKHYDISFNILDNYSDEYLISYRIVSRDTFLNLNFNDPANKRESFSRDSVIGLVNRDEFDYVGLGLKDNKDINVYRIDKSTIFIVWDDNENSNFKTSYYDYSNWLKLFTHEFGHAIGYRGHNGSKASKPIMYKDGSELMSWDVKEPNNEDIEHLKNVYDAN
ncbi:MAG: hypothetical protein ABF289_13815 [Clostridiales bacterium]